MKGYTLLLLLGLATLACAWTPFEFNTQHDMIEYMRDEDHHVYILYFYDSGNKGNYDAKVVHKEREAIKANGLEKYSDVYYKEFDVKDNAYEFVTHTLGLETSDVAEYPTVVAVSDGIGKWINGPNLSQLLVPTLNAIMRNKAQ